MAAPPFTLRPMQLSQTHFDVKGRPSLTMRKLWDQHRTSLTEQYDAQATFNEGLTATQTDLADTQTQLTATVFDLSATQADLVITQGQLTTAQALLATTVTNLGTTQSALSTAQATLATTVSGLSTAQSNITAAQASLTTAVADIATLQSDMADLDDLFADNFAYLSTTTAALITQFNRAVAFMNHAQTQLAVPYSGTMPTTI